MYPYQIGPELERRGILVIQFFVNPSLS
jgi:hypothetical protein